MKNEIFIDGKEFGKLPLKVRQKIIRALHLTLKPKRVRVYQPEEAEQLFREGTLPQVGGSLSMVGNVGDDVGVSMMTMSRGEPGADSAASSGKAEFLIDPTQPIIIGKLRGGVPPYLDPNYESIDVAPGGELVLGRKQDGSVSRAHLMLEGVVGKGIRITNGVPSSEGPGLIRPPTNETWISLPGKGEREMKPKEAVLIPLGSWAIIRLPNGANFRVDAKR